MHLKHIIKSNFLKRNSIPILLYRSIPLTCIMALLLLISSLMIVDYNSSEVHAEEGITTYATTSVNPAASLTIGGDATNKQVIASPGSTAYRSHTVTVDASDIEDYSLILSGPTNLVSGTSTVVAGAENKTPADMEENTWGYSWGGDSKKETSTYKSLSPTGTTLTGDRVSGFKVNFTRNLFFAAKFSEDADPGRYQANVTLSLAATPRAVATGFNGIYDMQDMTGEICAKANIGDAGSLEDVRDGNVYTVRKYEDGKCWMTRNLALTKESIEANGNSAILTSSDSNVESNYMMPASLYEIDKEDFSAAKIYSSQIYVSESTDNSAYYNYMAVTAGSGGEDLAKGDASASICPRGWRLPSFDDYNYLLDTTGIASMKKPEEKLQTVLDPPYAFVRAGGIWNGVLSFYGQAGYCWSSMIYIDDTVRAITLALGAPDLVAAGVEFGANWRSDGLPVRCVAEKAEEKTFTVTFDPNAEVSNGASDMPTEISCKTTTDSCEITLPTNAPVAKDGACNFSGWNENRSNLIGRDETTPPSTYSPGNSIMISQDTTLYAVWVWNGESSTS